MEYLGTHAFICIQIQITGDSYICVYLNVKICLQAKILNPAIIVIPTYTLDDLMDILLSFKWLCVCPGKSRTPHHSAMEIPNDLDSLASKQRLFWDISINLE